MSKQTICDLVSSAESITIDPELLEILEKIKERAGAMEDRLLKYCNAIEELGFSRDGRKYE
jgi:hypothetical protein